MHMVSDWTVQIQGIQIHWINYYFVLLVTGFPPGLGQNILLEIPWRISRDSLLWWQNLQGWFLFDSSLLAFLLLCLSPLFTHKLILWDKFTQVGSPPCIIHKFIVITLCSLAFFHSIPSICPLIFPYFHVANGLAWVYYDQGGNDHEIYESERTVGHTGPLCISNSLQAHFKCIVVIRMQWSNFHWQCKIFPNNCANNASDLSTILLFFLQLLIPKIQWSSAKLSSWATLEQ